ncbi:uncharacterized membrane protein (DUF485 family) [Deinobacterium chartae]|uniref:Uncharacterized membrane protein (DUF485 family) n=1 Tax=Deinobacterium chartae TaxID=521158 RepID=A0A841I5U9_9DEIO|nr:DUF485 domain-containing protein [Deinobacterium chartae]MBB6099810.1 uncharacterized membrane protein (DUF485 family) [Deinobacterium chartae]
MRSLSRSEHAGRIAEQPSFKALVRQRNRFVIGMTVFSLVFYLLLPLLAGYAREFMATPVWGNINIAYLFAFAQFVVGGVLAALYVRRAAQFDQTVARLKEEL